ncbi:MAG: 1-acyl-sn-glycerol-3-phosphate acyltransferase [Syntrophales bacterium]|jgi:1-acyl-sn-glycerol-3-phosphate acyltransferase|nr:1-acyl-sn-glycerol-3-phosphate acyltransferase [Syntrophales bacterium]MCK9391090.1 1-acyl-sn-glycerol-3-phosphate acyltransferase [Syntrophales bacterium]
MLRSVFMVTVSVIITAFISTCCVIFSLLGASENSIHKVARIWATMLLKITNVQVSVLGTEYISTERPQIFMSNHQSDFDIFIVLAYLPVQFRWLAKKELFRIPVFGKAMKKAGYIEIDRQNHERAMQNLVEASRKIREGKSVMSFPEGTRSMDGTIKAFKKGMFHLALEAGVPIVPITIIGASEIMPKRSLKINPGRITMIIDRPIDVTAYSEDSRSELTERVRSVIINNFHSRR